MATETSELDPERLVALPETALLDTVVAFYAQTLASTTEVRTYLQKRGLDSADAIARFRLGYSNRTLGLQLPETNRKAGGEIREHLQRLGIYRDTGREHLNGSLTIPILGSDGQVAMLYGRKITSGLRTGTPLHLYTADSRRGVWNREALTCETVPLVADSLLNGLTAWCAGITNTTATFGVAGITDEIVEALRATKTTKVALAFRSTEAGERAAEEVAKRLHEGGVEAVRLALPKGMDLNDYARAFLPSTLSLPQLMREALGEALPQSPPRAPESPVEAQPLPPTPEPSPPPAPVINQPSPTPEPIAATDPGAQPPGPIDEIVIVHEDRRYRIRGLAKNTSLAVMKVNVLVSRGDDGLFHADVLDLYQARQRAAFTKCASIELGCKEDVVKHDLGRVLLHLEGVQETAFRKALEPKNKPVALTAAEEAQALTLLKDPKLIDRVALDFQRVGVVGEESNLLVTYLAATSRLLDSPLAVVVQSSSAAGKSNLVKAALAFIPEEARLSFSAMSAQSLFYFGATDLQHRILSIAEEEGAERASYGLKLRQSEGEVSIASTGKDSSTGKLTTETYKVRGPVSLLLTTTAIEVDPELMNRCLVLSVNEERAQTQAIHRMQRRLQTLDGVQARAAEDSLRHLHQNAQRLLRPLLVVNPYAPRLTFLDDRTRTRRDHMKYLGLIQAIALLHQHQRPIKTTTINGKETDYVEVVPSDIALANRLVDQILGRSLDHMPSHTRQVLVAIDRWITDECERLGVDRKDFHFTRRDLRERLGGGDTQIKVHLARLVELEYLLVRRKGPGFAYELLFDGRGHDGRPFLSGLLDPASLSGYGEKRTDTGRASDGPKSGPGRNGEIDHSPNGSPGLAHNRADSPEIAYREHHLSPAVAPAPVVAESEA